jgi:hypothetical protein
VPRLSGNIVRSHDISSPFVRRIILEASINGDGLLTATRLTSAPHRLTDQYALTRKSHDTLSCHNGLPRVFPPIFGQARTGFRKASDDIFVFIRPQISHRLALTSQSHLGF